MRPLPFLIVAATSAQDMRSPKPTSEGIAGGEPAILSPWQTAHWLMYTALGLFSSVFSASAPVQATSLALT